MIPSISLYDEELLNSAYANIGLIADKSWAFDRGDRFRKLNHSLWVQYCKLIARHREHGNHQPRRVRDIIPRSRLAQYDNYEYDEGRERMYIASDIPFDPRADRYVGAITEPWMLDEVEEYFTRLNSTSPSRHDNELFAPFRGTTRERSTPEDRSTNHGTTRITQSNWDQLGCNDVVDPDDYDKYPPPRYSVDNMAELQLQARLTSDTVRDLWKPLKSQQDHGNYGQQYRQCNRQHQYHIQHGLKQHTLSARSWHQTSFPETSGIVHRPPPPILSAEVPEFFPKGPVNRFNNLQGQPITPLPFFPSSMERSYHDELFQYNRDHVRCGGTLLQNASLPTQQVPITTSLIRPSHQWIHRSNPTLQMQVPACSTTQQHICPAIVQHAIQFQDRFATNMPPVPTSIPVYQRPPELYADPCQRKKNQGVDFNNLILLTKNAMKARRNQSKNPQQSSSFILESRQPNLKSESDVLQWLDKGYPKRAKEFITLNRLVADFQSFEKKCDYKKRASIKQSNIDMTCYSDTSLPRLAKSAMKFHDYDNSNNATTGKRLYRDVLTNTLSTGTILENVSDKKYEELEQQAVEQYRTSEECLALRYQELEQQAVEQYRTEDETAGNTKSSNHKLSPVSSGSVGGETQQEPPNSDTGDEDVFISHKCLGFGNCSAIKETSSKMEKGVPVHPKITILRPESKAGTSSTHGGRSRKYDQTTISPKIHVTSNQKLSSNSKNTIKGASGDKIDTTVQASSKRHLILVSPLKRESEAQMTKVADFEDTYNSVQSMSRRVSATYCKPELLRTGCGDEKVTFLRSSETEGIRKQLFLATEELMDGSSENLAVRLLEPQQNYDGPCLILDLHRNLDQLSSPIVFVPDVTVGELKNKTNGTYICVSKTDGKQCRWTKSIAIENPSLFATRSKKTSTLTHICDTRYDFCEMNAILSAGSHPNRSWQCRSFTRIHNCRPHLGTYVGYNSSHQNCSPN